MRKQQSEENKPIIEPPMTDWQRNLKDGIINPLSGRQKDYNAAFMTQCIIEDFKRNNTKGTANIRFPIVKFWKLCSWGFMENEGIWKGAKEIHYNDKWTGLDHETLIRNFFIECHKTERNLESELLIIKKEYERLLN